MVLRTTLYTSMWKSVTHNHCSDKQMKQTGYHTTGNETFKD